jgi:hypothetical protein
MMPDIGTTIGNIFYREPRSVVYVADALRESQFVEVPYLYCTRIHKTAAPEVDSAALEYEYGTMIRPGDSGPTDYEKLSLVGKYVKVEIIDTVVDESDEPVASITWYGVIEDDSKEVMGSRGDVPTGLQTFSAFGVLRIAERIVITESIVEDPADDEETITIKHALPFNQDTGGIFVRRGNRSGEENDGSYIFSPQPRSLTAWDAYEAARYLFKKWSPKDSADNVSNQWKFHDSVTAAWLDWYDIAVECNNRTMKDILDDLINRKRGVGYFAEFNPDTDEIEVHVFSFVDADIDLPNDKTLTANPDQYTLDFEAAIDVEATVNTVGTTQYQKVLARGAKRTTTFTGKLLEPYGGIDNFVIWRRDWTDAEKQEFLDAASLEPGYTALDDAEKQRINLLRRSSDRLRNVFARWYLNPMWSKSVFDVLGSDNGTYAFNPELPEDPEEDPDPEGDNSPVWIPGCRVLRGLPFLDRYDYSEDKISEVEYGAGFTDEEQPEYIPPFAFLETEVPDSSPVEY